MNLFFIFVLLFILLRKTFPETSFKSLDEINITDYTTSKELSEKENKKYIFIKNFVYNLLSKYDLLNTGLPFDLVCSIVYQESSEQILNGMPSSSILGYDGLSIGYFQTTKWAVKEFNKREKGFNYTYPADMYIEEKHVYVGMCYLIYCYNSSNNDVFLTAKKYNGGLDETQTSPNTMANKYGNLIVKRYQIFKQISYKG